MSLIAIESFEFLNTLELQAKWNAFSVGVDASSGRDGTKCASMNGASDRIMFPGPGVNSDLVVLGTWMHIVAGLPTARSGSIQFWSTISVSFPQCQVQIETDGDVRVVRGTTTLLGETSNQPIPFDTDFTLEARVVMGDGTDGSVIVYLNGVDILNIPNVDTRNNAGANCDRADVVGMQGRTTFYDDCYVLGGDGAGPLNDVLNFWEVEGLAPNADGSTTDFPTLEPVSPTTHYTKLNDTPDLDTSYIASPDVGDIDLFEFTNLPVFGGSSIEAVQVTAVLKKDIASPTREARVLTRPVATNYPGTARGVAANDYNYNMHTWLVNPETGLKFTSAELEATEFGIELVT